MPAFSQEKKAPGSEPISYFLFNAGYRVPLGQGTIINSGHGLYFDGGINFAKFFSDKNVLGIYGGFSCMDRLWSTSFTERFAIEYGNAIKSERSLSGFDSTIINVSSDLVKNRRGRSPGSPGCEMRSWHNYSLYYGLQLKLPYKYFPLVKLYTGSTRTHFQGDGHLVSPDREYSIFEFKRVMHGCEIVLLSTNLNSDTEDKANEHYKIGLSLYYEGCNFYNSTLHFDDGFTQRDLPLRFYTNSSFLNKYRYESVFGFKFSFLLI
jgi:hypothetical protein